MRKSIFSHVFVLIILFTGLQLHCYCKIATGGNLQPPGLPGPTMKTLDEVEPRVPISSLPFIARDAGSYYLTGNLSVTGGGIVVDANNVTIDLMGYAINGDTSTGYGIYLNGKDNIEIKNGTIIGFSYGIFEFSSSGNGHQVMGVSVTNCVNDGIHLPNDKHHILNSSSTDNGGWGYWVEDASIMSGSIAYDNDGGGIRLGAGSTVVGSTAYENSGIGIKVGLGSTVDGNTVYNNSSNGIQAGDGCTVSGNTIHESGTNGIVAGVGCTVRGNTVFHNSGYGIDAGNGSTVRANSVRENSFSGIKVSSALVDGNTATENNQSAENYKNIDCTDCAQGYNYAPNIY